MAEMRVSKYSYPNNNNDDDSDDDDFFQRDNKQWY